VVGVEHEVNRQRRLMNTVQLIDAKSLIQILRISRRTLQYWEKAGKITPLRLPSGVKRYTEAHVQQAFNLTKKKRGAV
jgi:DNA-binding transcriptional MerR regulator